MDWCRRRDLLNPSAGEGQSARRLGQGRARTGVEIGTLRSRSSHAVDGGGNLPRSAWKTIDAKKLGPGWNLVLLGGPEDIVGLWYSMQRLISS